jgi:hypothetical protein
MKLIVQIVLFSLSFFSSFIISRNSGSNELNSLYYIFSLAPFLDFSLSSLIFKKVSLNETLIKQSFIGIISLFIFKDFLFFYLFVFSRQLLQSVINKYLLINNIEREKKLRLYNGVQLFIAGLIAFFIELKYALQLFTLINFIVVISEFLKERNVKTRNLKSSLFILSKNKTNYFKNFFFKGSISIIIGSFYISNLFLIIEKDNTLFLVIGLQILNALTNAYHLLKNHIFFKYNFSDLLNKFPYTKVYTILFFLSLISIWFFPIKSNTLYLVLIILIGEMGLIHISNLRMIKGDFNFVYRLSFIVLIQLLFIHNMLPFIIVFILISTVYYLASIIYGEVFILGSRSFRSKYIKF